jgi:diguanylate cyclase (GGDEF)-like protein
MHPPPPGQDGRLDALRRLFRPLPNGMQVEFDAQLDASLGRLLPVLGPVFGLFVVLFGAWDAWIDQMRASATVRTRIAMVLLGAPAYAAGRLPWNPSQRCAWLYATHVSAMVACAAMLPHGLVLALPGVTGTLFLLALVEPRPRRFMLATLPSSLLLALLAWLNLAPFLLLHILLLYALVWPLALCVALATLHLRRRAFLAEQAVLDAVRHDSLSGALSRRYVTELALHDLALARRHGRPLALAMLDIDHFKRVNDTWGHAAGDRALCALVRTCKENLRASDYIGRIGGEEFVCVMPEAGTDDALACAERIRTAVAALRLPAGADTLRFTVSAGVAVLAPEHGGLDDLLRAADAALYQAKEGGRNRTVLAPECAMRPAAASQPPA